MRGTRTIQASRFAGLGVDILSLTRARKFLRPEGLDRRLNKILSIPEKKRVKKKNSASLFAKYFTAKEAYFKTLNRSWLGIEGFQGIQIQLNKGGFFAGLIRGTQLVCKAEGRFIKGAGWIAAEAVRWEPVT